jgi:hypothetical protein
MRKRLIEPTAERPGTVGQGWLDLERAAVVELTSEDKEFPVESAFASEDARGWRAAAPGSQTIRLIFDHRNDSEAYSSFLRKSKRRVHKSSCCDASRMAGAHLKRLFTSSAISLRHNRFAKLNSIRLIFNNVEVLELVIKPEIGGGMARASLKNPRLS